MSEILSSPSNEASSYSTSKERIQLIPILLLQNGGGLTYCILCL
jgi:hypothetical protein